MKRFSVSVDIQAPPDSVWAIMTDIEPWPEWTPTVMQIQRLDDGPLAVGSRIRIRQPKLPPADWQMTELDRIERSFTWVTRSPGVQVTARHWVEAISQGSRVTLSIQFSGLLGPLVARLTRSLNERYLRLESEGLKRAASGIDGRSIE